MTTKYNITTFLYFGVASILCTFYYPYLNQKIGLSLVEVSTVVSFGALFCIFAQPYLGYLFSKVKNKKRFFIGYLSLIAIVTLLLMVGSKSTIFLIAPFYGMIVLPLIGTYEIYIEKISIQEGFEYSKVRKYGSIGLASVTLIGGMIIAKSGFMTMHILALIMIAICALLIIRVFPFIKVNNVSKKNNYKEVVKNKNVLLILIVCFLGIASYVGMDFAFSSYLTDITGDFNKSNSIYSISTGSKVFLEFISFIVIGKYLANANIKKCFLTVFLLSAIRFLLISTGIISMVIIGDQLHGIIFPLFLVFIFKYLREVVDDRLVSSSYALISVLVYGVSNLIFPSIFSQIQQSFGYTTMYLVCSSLSVIALVLGIVKLPEHKNSINVVEN